MVWKICLLCFILLLAVISYNKQMLRHSVNCCERRECGMFFGVPIPQFVVQIAVSSRYAILQMWHLCGLDADTLPHAYIFPLLACMCAAVEAIKFFFAW
jgi:hypothetical protein